MEGNEVINFTWLLVGFAEPVRGRSDRQADRFVGHPPNQIHAVPEEHQC